MTIGKLVAGANKEGYFTAIERAFTNNGDAAISPSALSQFRSGISFEFFKDIFSDHISAWQRKYSPKFEGLFVNAINGDKLNLPCTDRLLMNGYLGTPCKFDTETYYPTMFYCVSVDAITGVPVGFSQSQENDEISRAVELLNQADNQKSTVTIFDRFYLSRRIMEYYKEGEKTVYFIARCKTGSTFKEITEFAVSDLVTKKVTINEVKCRLIRCKLGNAIEDTILITNLPLRFKTKKIIALYAVRWECETGNRDRTTSIKIEQFHAKNLNGILQEVWMAFLLQTLSQIACAKEVKPEQYFLKSEYLRANFKAVFNKIADCFQCFINGSQKLFELTASLIQKTKQKRTHYKRSYPREIKSALGKSFPKKFLVARRQKQVTS